MTWARDDFLCLSFKALSYLTLFRKTFFLSFSLLDSRKLACASRFVCRVLEDLRWPIHGHGLREEGVWAEKNLLKRPKSLNNKEVIDNRVFVLSHQGEPTAQSFVILILIRIRALRKMTDLSTMTLFVSFLLLLIFIWLSFQLSAAQKQLCSIKSWWKKEWNIKSKMINEKN